MLGAVKGEPGTEDVPLFRLLARRWKSLAPVKRERTVLLSTRKDEPKPARAWTSKGSRAIYANRKVEPATTKRTWNPWLWVK